jgi:hypothetical protein
MNQHLVMWMGRENGIIDEEAWYSLRKDMATFINRPPAAAHWQQVAPYYVPSFAAFVNGLLKSNEGTRLE